MKKQHAIKWINALRSNEYKQSKSKLKRKGRTSTSYCCLGVLCELFPKLKLNESSYHRSISALPSFKKIGLRSTLGQLKYTSMSLSALNDNGYTFDEIADVIQIEYVEGV